MCRTRWSAIKKGEETDVKEEAKEGTPQSESQLTPHTTLHVPAISNDPVPCWALDDKGHTPQIGDEHPWTTSSCGEQVADTVRHAHHLHNAMCPPEHTHLDDPKPAVCVRKGQTLGFNANMQAHQAPCPGPGTITNKQDVHLVSEALLEREDLWVPSVSSKQTAAPGTPSTFSAPTSPALPSKATPPSSMPAPELDIPPLPAELVANAQQEHAPSPPCIDTTTVEFRSDPDPQPSSDRLAHSGTNNPCLAHIPDHPGAFTEDPGESGEVPMVENGALAPLADPDGAVLTFAAETAGTPAPRTPAEAKCSHE